MKFTAFKGLFSALGVNNHRTSNLNNADDDMIESTGGRGTPGLVRHAHVDERDDNKKGLCQTGHMQV